jgi:hypothetical protein
MKTMDKDSIIAGNHLNNVLRERLVHEEVIGVPFLVGLKYAFQTQSQLYLVLGEYIKVVCMVVRASLNVQGPC